jgi:ArsR family transcriptional regulator
MAAAVDLSVTPLTRVCRALGDDTRARIVALLAHGELCVCHVEAALGLSQPKVSRHLAILRAAGVVQRRRQGTWMYYRLAPQPDPVAHGVVDAVVRAYRRRDRLRRDLERLVKSKGPTPCP